MFEGVCGFGSGPIVPQSYFQFRKNHKYFAKLLVCEAITARIFIGFPLILHFTGISEVD